ncbi:O-antigen ligase family protein [Solibacillus silvestris]|uniref:O-antigen ligase family protein n=1 Tax=Solibacillus silvestris TaxID=76853 RepID=UPI003F7EA30E
MSKLNYKTKLNPDLYLFYFLWPIIIAPKEIQFIIIFAVLLNLLCRHKLYFDALSYFMLGFIFIYLFSIIYNVIGNSFEFSRILATINTFSLWIFSLIFYLIFRSINIDMNKIKKAAFINYCILITLWVCSLLIYCITKYSDFKVANRILYYTEWFGNMKVIRFVGFMDYSNLIIVFFMFFYPLFLLTVLEMRNPLIKILLTIGGLLPIITTFSRSGYLIVLLYLFIISLIYLYGKVNKKLFTASVFFTLSLVLPIVIYTNFPDGVFSILKELFEAREGSNDSRTYLMKESIRMTMENSPLIGMGVKVTSLIGYPLGSHSTIVGFFYKTGILGLIAGAAIFLIINIKMLLSGGNMDKKLMKISLLIMSSLFIVEDIDGSNWIIIFYFLLAALIVNNRKKNMESFITQ